jgi:hypothetical protein
MALITTVGGTTSDSYVSVAESNTYFANHYSLSKSTLWDTLETAQKERLLRTSCLFVDQVRVLDDTVASGALVSALVDATKLSEITIHKLNSGQRLQFPRNLDHVDEVGYIPDAIKVAQFEQAIYLLSMDDGPVSAQFLGVVEERTKVGSIEVMQRFGSSRTGSGTTVSPLSQTLLSPITVDLMKPFIRPQRRIRRS